ncbi:MAG: hypothetical protein D6815_06790 [Candidatus Dadabacteria bacterium]|nr:MAG: hypothetical protein D6815_06790 [Candidatus Dadabacteria bacterium]
MKRPKTLARGALLVFVNAIVFALLLLILEGAAAYFLVLKEVVKSQFVAEHRHTTYDPELGWVNEPNLYIPNMYKPGGYLRINAQGFRNNEDFSERIPPGKKRIICCGDSFTLGYGVDNDHTWCELLRSHDRELETVNMGQGGYGLGQMYLWYRRDAAALEHDLLIVAVITEDFSRMMENSFFGYAKPRFDIEDGRLVLRNVPVPRRGYFIPWFNVAYAESRRRLNTFHLIDWIAHKTGIRPYWSASASSNSTPEKRRRLIYMLLGEMKRLSDERSSRMVLVYLPQLGELSPHGPPDLAKVTARAAEQTGIVFVNLLSEFRKLPYDRAAELFIKEGELRYTGAGGHFNEEGNRVVADLLWQALKEQRLLDARGRIADAR